MSKLPSVLVPATAMQHHPQLHEIEFTIRKAADSQIMIAEMSHPSVKSNNTDVTSSGNNIISDRCVNNRLTVGASLCQPYCSRPTGGKYSSPAVGIRTDNSTFPEKLKDLAFSQGDVTPKVMITCFVIKSILVLTAANHFFNAFLIQVTSQVHLGQKWEPPNCEEAQKLAENAKFHNG